MHYEVQFSHKNDQILSIMSMQEKLEGHCFKGSKLITERQIPTCDPRKLILYNSTIEGGEEITENDPPWWGRHSKQPSSEKT